MKNCNECGRAVMDDIECPYCTKSTELDKISFDPMQEVLKLYEKMDRIESELIVVHENIESLTRSSLNHSEAFLSLINAIGLLRQAIEQMPKKD